MAEEVRTETYDNYKFLTVPELRSLSLAHLVGKTNLLRPYMHGYFVASKLYDQARLIANPYVWEEERMKRVKEKIEKERASRIRGHKKVKVNQKVVDRLLKKQEKRDKVDNEAGILGDPRFQRMFEDPEFLVNENHPEFRALNPSTQVGEPGEEETHHSNKKNSDDEGDGGSGSDRPVRKNDGNVAMRASLSSEKRRWRSNDTALGSRTRKSGRTSKIRQGGTAGEREVTFVPTSKTPERQPSAALARRDSRRSASGNTFRRL